MSQSKNRCLEALPKLTTLNFYIKSVFIGLWVLFKWLIYFLWKSVNQKRSVKETSQTNSRAYRFSECDNHDKPPACLVDNSYGRHSYVKLKGVKLHYVEAGNRNDPVILLLHGCPDCWLGWRHQIADLSQFFRVIALDLKGFNDSDKPQWRKDYTPDKICREIYQFIKSIGVKSATIIGHDFGALIGWIFSHTYPDYIDRFICVSTSHPNLFWENLVPNQTFNTTFLQFAQLPFLPEMELASEDSTQLEKNFPHLEKLNSSNKRNVIDENATVMNAYRYVFSRKSDWTGPLNYYRNFPFYRIRDGDIIRCPILIITGSDDSVCSLETVVKSADFCDNCTVKIIDGADHWPHQQNPKEFNRVILKFLVGRRASLIDKPLLRSPSKGLFSRVFGAVHDNTTKLGGFVMESVHQKTNEAIIKTIQS